MSKTYFAKVIEIDNEIGIEFPDELLDEMNLKHGDMLELIREEDAVVLRVMKKIQKTK